MRIIDEYDQVGEADDCPDSRGNIAPVSMTTGAASAVRSPFSFNIRADQLPVGNHQMQNRQKAAQNILQFIT